MKVLFNTGHTYLHGGIEKSITERANYFAKQPGYQVFILTTEQQNKPPCYPLDPNIKQIDLAINYNREKSYLTYENIRKGLKHYRAQKETIREIKPDVILSPNFNFDHYWLPFIKKEAKLIKERHNSFYAKQNGNQNKTLLQKVKNKFDTWIAEKYDHIVVLNKGEKAFVKSSNAVLTPNGIEITDQAAQLENKKVIAAGRIAPVKRFDELIAIWKKINEQFPDWELHIYGQDYLNTTSQLCATINSFNLQDKVGIKESLIKMPQLLLDYSVKVIVY